MPGRGACIAGVWLAALGFWGARADYRPYPSGHGDAPPAVLYCVDLLGRAVPCGTVDTPLQAAAGPVDWRAAAQASIAADGVYQTLFPAGAAPHGGLITNTCAPGSAPIWLDVTGATGTTPSAAAQPIYPAASSGSAPGAFRFPGTTHAVTVIGPAGCTFAAFGG